MWSRVPCEQQLNMGQSVLSDRTCPFGILDCSQRVTRDADRKGIRLRFLNLTRGMTRKGQCGNATELGDVGDSPGKSYLFFVRARVPWNRLGRR
jgi:hypothetical protein